MEERSGVGVGGLHIKKQYYVLCAARTGRLEFSKHIFPINVS